MITVDRRATQALVPGDRRRDPLRIWRAGHVDGEACHSVAISGPCLLRYDPARRIVGGPTLALIVAGAHLVTPLPAAAAAAALAELELGRPTYVHVNSHRAAADRRNGTASPIIAVRLSRSGRPTYVSALAVRGPSWLLCCPERPICGAKVYLVVPRTSGLRLLGHPRAAPRP